jgi:hypothetical protein
LTYISSATGDDKYKEWIYTGDPTAAVDNSKWVVIGETSLDLSNYKTKQTAKSSPTASGNTLAFIDTISQDANGVITATKKNVTIDTALSTSSTNPVQNKVINSALSGKKDTQTAVSDPTASGTSITFIASITQNEQGVISPTKKTVSTMGAASSSAAGTAGLVPAPGSGKQGSFLRGDGTWQTPTDSKVTQTKLAGTETGAYPIILKNSTTATDSTTNTVNYVPGITITPSTKTITATNFAGTATTAKDYSSSGGIATALAGKKDTQTAVSDPSAGSTPTLSFIATISQDAQGVITATKENVKIDTALSSSSTNPVQNKVVNTAINAKYTKPSTGIPKTDLASAVQTSLGKADSSVQDVTVAGTTVVNSSKVAQIAAATTPTGTTAGAEGSYGVVKLEIISI